MDDLGLITFFKADRVETEDWLEFAVTMALFFALLCGFYVGLIGSWQA